MPVQQQTLPEKLQQVRQSRTIISIAKCCKSNPVTDGAEQALKDYKHCTNLVLDNPS